MNTNVIAFDRNRKNPGRPCETSRKASSLGKVVSIAEWKLRSHARRTANGVFFSTSVLLTSGSVA